MTHECATEDAFTKAQPPRGSHPRIGWTDAQGRHTAVLSGTVVAGSAPGAGLIVRHPTVSRLHAEFEVRPDGAWVHDLGSKNGTFVDGVLVKSARVPNGGRIALGTTVLVVEYDARREPEAAWPHDRFGALVGGTAPMRRLFAQLARIAPTESSVLVHGETGTGKEEVARAIHEHSARKDGPFVVVDCAAIPENLFEAQIFGHARGAFTGAIGARAGDLESAAGGTVFLDEVGELSLAMQPKLLRALESRTVRRLGETQARGIDVRFVSATHRDLRKMVNAGAFREDLYFRLAVVPLTVPPLRDRLADVPALVRRFSPAGQHVLCPEMERQLTTRPWMGNVRELRNFVERAVAMGAAEALSLSSEPPVDASPAATSPAIACDAPFKDFRERWIDRGEREYVRQILVRHGGSVTDAAQAAGIGRTYLYRLIKKHSL